MTSTEELEAGPHMKAGDVIVCPTCGERHVIESRRGQTRNANGEWVDGKFEFLFYRCGERMYMAGLDGKSVLR